MYFVQIFLSKIKQFPLFFTQFASHCTYFRAEFHDNVISIEKQISEEVNNWNAKLCICLESNVFCILY